MKRNGWELKEDLFLAAGVGVVSLIVYLWTLTPTVPFWDSGEFIATSYVLGIPHPPGTPLYVLLGRLFSIVPIGSIAQRVNVLSSIPSALAVAFTYLLIARILAGCGKPFCRAATSGANTEPANEWPPRPSGISRFGAVLGALVMAFSDTYWLNAVEAEVYALAALVMVGTVYLMLKWRDVRHMGAEAAARANNIVVLVLYMLALSIAFHMGTFIVFLPLVLFFVSDHYRSLSDKRFVITVVLMVVLSFLLGFHRASMLYSGLIIVALMLINLDIIRGRLMTTLVTGLGLMAVGALLMKQIGPMVGLLIMLALAGVVFWMWSGLLVRNNLGFWVTVVFVLGLSVHIFLVIRAGLGPAINEADPSSLENFWLVISRDQYKPGPPWVFRADLHAKFVTHFWDYWKPQYDIGVRQLWVVPFLLCIGGAVVNFMRSRRTFLLIGFLVFVASIGLIWHLNFKLDEVRERDYFFVSLFHFAAIWIGMGATGFLYFVRESFSPGMSRRVVLVIAGALLLFLPLGQLRAGWYHHDRSGFYVARDYAYNLLMPLAEGSILFTNGDNDTFPLWYLQEVEGIRTDVRVANLSLLNTDWYIKQLRDMEPRVPISWNDDQIETLEELLHYSVSRYTGRSWNMTAKLRESWTDQEFRQAIELGHEFVQRDERWTQIKDNAVDHIVRTNNFERPLYVAVTVPDLMGYDDRLIMEGLAWRVTAEPVTEGVDEEKILHNFEHVYKWRGLLDDQGKLDPDVYKDSNATKLVQNYAAALHRLAQAYMIRARDHERAGRIEEAKAAEHQAIEQLEIAQGFKSGFSPLMLALGPLYYRAGELEKAEAHLSKMIDQVLDARPTFDDFLVELHYSRGDVRASLADHRGAAGDFTIVINLAPMAWEGYQGLARAQAAMGDTVGAISVLNQWVAAHPGHAQAEALKRLLGGPAADGASGGGGE